MVRRFLLLPLLAPWLLVLLVAALNPRPMLSLRLLVWSSPPLPIGTWLALASSGGAVLSVSASALALRGRGGSTGRAPRLGSRFSPGSRWRRSIDDRDDGVAADRAPANAPSPAAAGPRRAPGEPAPTVSVPFRVIRRGSNAGVASSASSSAQAAPASGRNRRRWGPFGTDQDPAVSRTPAAATSTGDGWGDDGDEDW